MTTMKVLIVAMNLLELGCIYVLWDCYVADRKTIADLQRRLDSPTKGYPDDH